MDSRCPSIAVEECTHPLSLRRPALFRGATLAAGPAVAAENGTPLEFHGVIGPRRVHQRRRACAAPTRLQGARGRLARMRLRVAKILLALTAGLLVSISVAWKASTQALKRPPVLGPPASAHGKYVPAAVYQGFATELIYI